MQWISTCAVRVFVTGLFVGVLGVLPAWATHDAACSALPTSGQRPGQVPCNPRQECLGKIPANVHGPARTSAEAVCNRLAAQGSCPGSVSFNPRQECVAKLPPPTDIEISTIFRDEVSPKMDLLPRGKPFTFTLEGKNLGVPGVRLTAHDPDLDVSLRAPVGGTNTIKLQASAPAGAPCGYRSFTLTAPGGHDTARGRIFVTVNHVDEPKSMPSDTGAGSIKLRLDNSGPGNPRSVHHGWNLTGQIQYFGGARTNTIQLSTSHPRNVSLSPASIAIPPGVTNSTFNFHVRFTHTKETCLNGPVEIYATSGQDRAVMHVFIVPDH